MEPEILIFDEPMAALDPVNARNVENILQNLHKDGKTLLVATHDVVSHTDLRTAYWFLRMES